MLFELKKNIIYGPVNSRRLGRSLGINLLPGGAKVCTLDCLYCHFGLKQGGSVRESRGNAFPSVAAVIEAVEEAVLSMETPVDYLTFSGNGEATLHPRFGEIVAEVCRLRDRITPDSKTAILSNATTVNDPTTREALSLLDVRYMKLDAGSETMFNQYSRPGRGITLAQTIAGLSLMEDVSLQSLFSGGPEGNFDQEHVSAWLDAVDVIQPVFVQLYSISRPSPTRSLTPVTEDRLTGIGKQLDSKGIRYGVFS